jgi:hypothetical protein
MKPVFTFLILFCFYSYSFSQSKKVLWIGNSYTAVNNLPLLTYNLALSAGDTLIYDSNTPGGMTFNGHSTNAATLQKIALGDWDNVILQAQSQEPSFSPGQVASQTTPFARKLDSLVHAASPCAETVFYMTWGRKFGDASNCANYPPVCTFSGMTDRLRSSYKLMADENEALLAPVGMAWKKAWETDATIDLWSSDNSHPSVAGSYLAACVFYTTLFKKTPVGLTYNAGLSGANALFLQEVAASVFFDSLSVWNVDRFRPIADFNSSANGTLVSFSQNSQNATQYFWDFGDGNSSDEMLPTHDYSIIEGQFNVQLIVSDGCFSDTTIKTVLISPLGLNKILKKEIHIYPNPTEGILNIKSENLIDMQYSILDYLGRVVVSSNPLLSNSINCTSLNSGMYFIKFENKYSNNFISFIKLN